ncbi:VOC family protein [Aestuariibius sp. 2305UL40-4]|uniref:VOC family protein n=1 Tax=Aestuariibius violaceus TaxID=3234132 RepID=UPI00345E51CC
MQITFDHLAVTAPSLEAGLAHVEARLGLIVPPGGAHPRMGTHNRLMRLFPDEFLEIIAINPEASAPDRPRWFGFDRIGGAPARLSTWLCRCEDLDATLAALPEGMGEPLEMTRGDLRWRIAVRPDGELPFGGAFPTLIEWPMRPFPGAAMADLECRLERLEIRHPKASEVAGLLEPQFQDDRITFERADEVALRAEIGTPEGTRLLV